MSALREYRETIRYQNRKEVSQERAELFKILNGDAFFPLKTWPDERKMVFWHKPIGDKDTLKLAPFLLLDLQVDPSVTMLGATQS